MENDEVLKDIIVIQKIARKIKILEKYKHLKINNPMNLIILNYQNSIKRNLNLNKS